MFKYAIALVAAFGVGVATAQIHRTVPSSLLSMAQRVPLEFAFLLADASVPSGIEIRETDDVYLRTTPDINLDREVRVPAQDLVQAFNSHHRDYQAMLMDGVFVIRPVDSRARFLDGPSTIDPPVSIVGTMAAVGHIFAPLDPRLLGPVIGGGIGREAAKGLTTRVVLDGTHGRRVIDTLNQLVRQAPGTWQVTTRQHGSKWEIVKFSFIYAGRSRVSQQVGSN